MSKSHKTIFLYKCFQLGPLYQASVFYQEGENRFRIPLKKNCVGGIFWGHTPIIFLPFLFFYVMLPYYTSGDEKIIMIFFHAYQGASSFVSEFPLPLLTEKWGFSIYWVFSCFRRFCVVFLFFLRATLKSQNQSPQHLTSFFCFGRFFTELMKSWNEHFLGEHILIHNFNKQKLVIGVKTAFTCLFSEDFHFVSNTFTTKKKKLTSLAFTLQGSKNTHRGAVGARGLCGRALVQPCPGLNSLEAGGCCCCYYC